jgi:uncharacterized protein
LELTGRRRLPIDRGAAWRALNDPAILRACIPGCESIEKTGENEYAVALVAALGPVRAKFRGKLRLEDVVVPDSYVLRFEGEGGAAGFAKGSAKVVLSDQDAATLLEYSVKSQVGGKIAQVGNRLMDSAARKLADDFFKCFEEKVSGNAPSQDQEPAPPGSSVPPLRVVLVGVILTLLVASVAYTLR